MISVFCVWHPQVPPPLWCLPSSPLLTSRARRVISIRNKHLEVAALLCAGPRLFPRHPERTPLEAARGRAPLRARTSRGTCSFSSHPRGRHRSAGGLGWWKGPGTKPSLLSRPERAWADRATAVACKRGHAQGRESSGARRSGRVRPPLSPPPFPKHGPKNRRNQVSKRKRNEKVACHDLRHALRLLFCLRGSPLLGLPPAFPDQKRPGRTAISHGLWSGSSSFSSLPVHLPATHHRLLPRLGKSTGRRPGLHPRLFAAAAAWGWSALPGLLPELHGFWGAWALLRAGWVQGGTQCFPFVSPQALGFHSRPTRPRCSVWFCSNRNRITCCVSCWELAARSGEGRGYGVFAITVSFFPSWWEIAPSSFAQITPENAEQLFLTRMCSVQAGVRTHALPCLSLWCSKECRVYPPGPKKEPLRASSARSSSAPAVCVCESCSRRHRVSPFSSVHRAGTVTETHSVFSICFLSGAFYAMVWFSRSRRMQ